jgi:hypothetical protein
LVKLARENCTQKKSSDFVPNEKSGSSNIEMSSRLIQTPQPDDILSITVNDPELLEIISSIQKVDEEGNQRDVDLNRSSTQTTNTPAKGPRIISSEESYICSTEEAHTHNNLALVNYFKNFNDSDTIEKEEDLPTNIEFSQQALQKMINIMRPN